MKEHIGSGVHQCWGGDSIYRCINNIGEMEHGLKVLPVCRVLECGVTEVITPCPYLNKTPQEVDDIKNRGAEFDYHKKILKEYAR